MLHALIHKKTSLSRGYSEPTEDEITSCVFGPLRLMEPSVAWKSCLIMLGNPPLFQNVETPTHVDFRFWPRWRAANDSEGNWIESDVYIVAKKNRKTIATVCIEIKWV